MRKISLSTSLLMICLTGLSAGQTPAPQPTVEIKQVEYKELRDDKHRILLAWDISQLASEFKLSRITLDLELTDATGARRKATLILDAKAARTGDVSFTPVPIPKDPIVGVPISDLFRRVKFDSNSGANDLKFKALLTATITNRQSLNRTLTAIAKREGTIKAQR